MAQDDAGLTDAELEELATLHSRKSIDLPPGRSLAAYILDRYVDLAPKAARELQQMRERFYALPDPERNEEE